MLILKNKGSCHISALCKANCSYTTAIASKWTGKGRKVIKYSGMQQYLREFQIQASTPRSKLLQITLHLMHFRHHLTKTLLLGVLVHHHQKREKSRLLLNTTAAGMKTYYKFAIEWKVAKLRISGRDEKLFWRKFTSLWTCSCSVPVVHAVVVAGIEAMWRNSWAEYKCL